MAIMHKMRENTHIILIFLLVMFVASMTIGGLVGGANIMDLLSGKKADTILTVNGEEIPYEQFSRAYQAEIDAYRQKNDKEPEGYQLQRIEDQVWDSFVRDILKRQLIEKLNIGVTREEVSYFIFNNPHPIFQMDQNFWNEKNEFDPEKFKAALSSPGNDRFWQYKEEYLKMILPFEKLDEEIIATVRVTDNELKVEFRKTNEKVKASYIFFNSSNYQIADEQITDDQIKKYYEEHGDEFKEEEKRKISYVLFDILPSEQDSAETRLFATTLMDSARNGTDFAELAEIYSDDPGSAAKGGDLGYFGRGAMVKPFEEAAFSAAVGDVVGPVLSNFGLHVIKVEDKKIEDGKEEVKARHILLKFKASRQTQETARDNGNYFVEIAQEDGFEQAVLTEKIKADTADYFAKSGFIPKLGMQKRIALSVFNKKIGEVSKVYFIENKGYLVYEVIGIKEEGTLPLSEVKTRVMNSIRQEKQMELAGNAAREFREKILAPEDMERIAQQDSLEVNQADQLTMDGSVRGIGRDPNFNGTAFALDEHEVSAPVKGARGYYVIRTDEKLPFDENAFKAQKNDLKNKLLDEKRRAVYTSWISNLKDQAEIEDFRYMFF